MTKIAIISQPEQGVLIDIGGCDTVNEATQHLSSTFQVANQFWEDQPVDLNLGNLRLSRDEFAQILAILAERGVTARQYFATEDATREALRSHNVEPASHKPGEPIPPPPQVTVSTADESSIPALPQTASDAPKTVSADAIAGNVPDASLADGTATAATAVVTEATKADTIVVPKSSAAPAVPYVLYVRQNLRSGQSVSHKGHLVIVGDVNPGAEVMAEGDITIWGTLRGMAHAGIAGNTNSEIRALKFDPIQLRIAHAIARSPDRPRANLHSSGPETARIVNGTIRISSTAVE